MSGLSRSCLLPVLLLMAPLPVCGQARSGQAAVPFPSTAAATSEFQPTPEEQGDALAARQRFQAAIEAYRKDAHPSARVWNKMGIAYQMLYDLKDAARCYRKSLKTDSRNATVWNNLGTVYDSRKNYGKAERMYRRALKLAPQSAVTYKNLGTSLLKQRKYDKGMHAYQKAATIDPEVFVDHDSPRVSNPSSVRDRGAMNYYMALGCVHAGQTSCALDYLRLALNEGYTTAKKLAEDENFLSLRGNPDFRKLLAEQEPSQQ